MELAALAEQFQHPSHLSVHRRPPGGRAPDPARVTDVKEIAGQGVQAVVDGRTVLAGNQKLMDQFQISSEDRCRHMGTIIHVAVDGEYAGHIVISDQVKPEAAQALSDLEGRRSPPHGHAHRRRPERPPRAWPGSWVWMSSTPSFCPETRWTGWSDLLAQKSPRESLSLWATASTTPPSSPGRTSGVAMGALGSDAAIEAADIVLMDDDLSKLAQAVRIARKTLSHRPSEHRLRPGGEGAGAGPVRPGLCAGMWWAVFADVGVSVLAILNASRMLRAK